MNLTVLYEDKSLLVIEKPAGLVMYAGNGTGAHETTVATAVAAWVEEDASERPGIVHRLDRDTSGVLLIARNHKTKEFLQAQFKRREVEKEYTAAVKGTPKHRQARLEWPIARHPKNPLKRAVRSGGKVAITEYEVIETRDGKSLLRLYPHTGRTHQIRVHMQHLGHPILGDTLYGGACPGLTRQFLHASSLTFNHPDGHRMSVTSELPEDLQRFWYNEARNGPIVAPTDS